MIKDIKMQEGSWFTYRIFKCIVEEQLDNTTLYRIERISTGEVVERNVSAIKQKKLMDYIDKVYFGGIR